jgi:two-component system, NarL family, nitrate/nitrite response regulator NarL
MRILIADAVLSRRAVLSEKILSKQNDATAEEVSSFDELWCQANACESGFDVFLIDIHLPGMSLLAIDVLKKKFPDTPIAIMSEAAQEFDLRAAVQAGVQGYIPGAVTGEYLVSMLRFLLAGGTSVPCSLCWRTKSRNQASSSDAASLFRNLTSRERSILMRVARGLSNKEIGRELGLAEVTIKLHLRGVFRKIGARSRVDAAVITTKSGFV